MPEGRGEEGGREAGATWVDSMGEGGNWLVGCGVAWRHVGEADAQQTGDKRRPRLGCDAALVDTPP